jgi:hypothetical protein
MYSLECSFVLKRWNCFLKLIRSIACWLRDF